MTIKEIYKKVAEENDVSLDIVEELMRFQWKSVREHLHGHNQLIQVPGLFHLQFSRPRAKHRFLLLKGKEELNEKENKELLYLIEKGVEGQDSHFRRPSFISYHQGRQDKTEDLQE